MSYGKRVAVMLVAVIVGAFFLLATSGVLTATAATGPFRIHITGGVVVVGHGVACFVREGEAVGTASATGLSTNGRFVVNLKIPTTAAPCGTISGTIRFEADPHLAGFFGRFSGQVTEESGPTEANFIGGFVTGTWQIQHVSAGPTPAEAVAVGEGTLNVTKF